MTKSPDAFRTISEVAEDLDLPQHVLRFWETRFVHIRPMKRGGGRRYYRPDDIDLLRGIRHLLYGEGYTIRGVQRILKEQGPRFVAAAGRGELTGLADLRDSTDDEGDEEALVEVEAPEVQPPVEHAPEAAAADMARRFVPHQGNGTREMPPRSMAALPKADIDRLNATMSDLLECKRLLDQAR